MENAVYSFSKMMMEFWRIYKYKWLKIESNLSLSLKGIIVCPAGHPFLEVRKRSLQFFTWKIHIH
jgi:hypothetical protein